MTDEEVDKLAKEAVERIWPKLQYKMKKRRNKFLQSTLEEMKKDGANPDKTYSDGWWEHIPDDDETRHGLTGLYMAPRPNSKVLICKDHPFVEGWMREEGVFGVVLSVQPCPTITARDKNGDIILGKDGKEVRMPGIPPVEVAFPQNDYQGGLYLPADCLKEVKDDERAEQDDEEAQEDED